MTDAATPPPRLTLAAFARHLKVAKSYVTKLKKADRLVLDDTGHVLVAESIKRIADTQLGHTGAIVTEPFSEARERKELYQAANARVDFEQRCGQLTEARQVADAAANAGVLIRKRAESMPADLAPELAAKGSEEECRHLLTAWVESFLADASAQLAAIGAGARGGVAAAGQGAAP